MNNKPVAWMSKIDNHIVTFDKRLVNEAEQAGADNWMPMYLHPVKELTDEEILELGDKHLVLVQEYIGCGDYVSNVEGEIDFARAILRKAQEK